jgi:hypothetical protein
LDDNEVLKDLKEMIDVQNTMFLNKSGVAIGTFSEEKQEILHLLSQLDENLLSQDETQFQPISSRSHRRGQFVR